MPVLVLSFLLILPTEIWSSITQHLTDTDITALLLTSKQLYKRLTESEHFFKHLLIQRFGHHMKGLFNQKIETAPEIQPNRYYQIFSQRKKAFQRALIIWDKLAHFMIPFTRNTFALNRTEYLPHFLEELKNLEITVGCIIPPSLYGSLMACNGQAINAPKIDHILWGAKLLSCREIATEYQRDKQSPFRSPDWITISTSENFKVFQMHLLTENIRLYGNWSTQILNPTNFLDLLDLILEESKNKSIKP